MADPNIIGGSLPWQSAGGGANQFQGLAGSPQQAMASLGSNYAGAYNSALQMNAANYQNILQGYQQTMGAQTSAQNAIGRGYSDLYNSVLGGIKGIGASQAQNIRDVYEQQSGAAAQGLIARGLGNTTVQNSVQRGLVADESKAQVNLANQIANLTAGYQSNLGLAGLGYQGQAAQQNTALAGRQLDWMNSVNAQYPHGGIYGQLASQFGAAQQAGLDRQQAAQARQQMLGAAQMAGRGVGGSLSVGGGGLPPPEGGAVSTGAGVYGAGGGFGGYGAGLPATNAPAGMSYLDATGEPAADFSGQYSSYEDLYGAPSPAGAVLGGGAGLNWYNTAGWDSADFGGGEF